VRISAYFPEDSTETACFLELVFRERNRPDKGIFEETLVLLQFPLQAGITFFSLFFGHFSDKVFVFPDNVFPRRTMFLREFSKIAITFFLWGNFFVFSSTESRVAVSVFGTLSLVSPNIVPGSGAIFVRSKIKKK
jgi:hypothetical protein